MLPWSVDLLTLKPWLGSISVETVVAVDQVTGPSLPWESCGWNEIYSRDPLYDHDLDPKY